MFTCKLKGGKGCTEYWVFARLVWLVPSLSSNKVVNGNLSKELFELDSKNEEEVVTWFDGVFWTPRPYVWSAAYFKITFLLAFIAG